FFARGVAVGYLLGAGLAAGVVLGLNADGAAPAEWLLVMATSTAVGSVIWRVRAQLWRVAMTDTLTGLANRQGLDYLLEREIGRIRRRGGRLSVAMVDLDGFKALNDRLGHAAGDAALAEIARQWREVLRDRDLLARYGGDEFVILLPDTEGDAAIQLVARLRHSETQPFSAGVATLTASDTATTLMHRADSAMYAAKRSPRHPPPTLAHPLEDPDKVRR
ncbi:MAG: GGDEF domain-containing protein, partial [Actinomycetota bacterium]|nr:GGDEF domain-containing protein [Actinomycetota bacterium]